MKESGIAFINSVNGIPFKIPTKNEVINKARKALILAPEIKTNNKIIKQRKPSCHYLYLLPSSTTYKTEESANFIRKKIAYCRVSSIKQQDDLSRQIAFFQSQYPDYEIIKDIIKL